MFRICNIESISLAIYSFCPCFRVYTSSSKDRELRDTNFRVHVRFRDGNGRDHGISVTSFGRNETKTAIT